MKKTLLLLSISITILMSCSSKDSIEEESPKEEVQPADTTPYSPEQGKQALEDNMIAALNEIDGFANDPALTEIEEFAKFLLDNPDSQSGIVSKSLSNTLSFKNKTPQLFAKSQITSVSEPAEGLQDEYNELVGNWIWSISENKFVRTSDSGNNIVYTVTQNNKNAVLTVSNFSVLTHPSGEEIPTSINVVLTVDGTTVFSQEYAVSFPSDKYIPSSLSNTTTLGGLSFETNLSNTNNTETTVNSAIKLNGTTLIGASVKANGNYTEINNTGESTSETNTLLNTISASYTMLSATISIEASLPETIDDEATADEQIELLNERLNVSLSVNDKKVADGEFYKESELKDVHEYHDEAKYVIRDQRPNGNYYNQIDLLDTQAELENSIYYNNYYLYYYPKTIIEEDVVTAYNPYNYIQNQYPTGYYNGYYVEYNITNSEWVDNNYVYTFDVYYKDYNRVIIEESVINFNIYSYIETTYTDGQYNGNYIYSSKNYYYSYSPSNYYTTEKLVESPNLKFVFEDGTKSTIEAYFDTGFNSIQTKLEDVLINFENLIED